MALSGLWKAATSYESGALKWGTGVNPIHGIATMGQALRQSEIVHPYGPGQPAPPVPVELVDPGVASDYDYIEEEYASAIWGYGPETGTSERPGLGSEGDNTTTTPVSRSDSDDFPPWGPTGKTNPWGPTGGQIPAGANLRAKSKGGLIPRYLKLGIQQNTVADGWMNKAVSGVEDSQVSDPSQYEMQTSMTQRDKVRQGSQAQPGRASEFLAPIASPRPTWGQRMKIWSGTPRGRHYDMYPFQAEEIIRPFRDRSAGTGYAEWLAANEATNYMVSPLERVPVPDPSAGNPTPQPGNVYAEESSNVSTWVNAWY
jgi:hypothetical protein